MSPGVANDIPVPAPESGVRRPLGLTRDRELTALVGLVFFALCLRLPLLALLPANLTQGEGQQLAAALSLLARHWPTSDAAPGLGPGLSAYVEAACLALLGAHAAAARLPAALVGALCLVQFYLLARLRCRPLAALGAGALLAASVWSLSLSRAASGETWVVLYALLTAGALARAERAERPLYAWACAGAWLGLALLEPPGGRWLAAALAAYFIVHVYVRRVQPSQALARGAAAVAAASAVFLVLQFSHPGGPETALAAALGAPVGPDGQSLPVRLLNALRTFLLIDGSTLTNQQLSPPSRPLFDTITALLYLAGLVSAGRRWRETALWWCFLLVPVAASALFDRAAVDLASVTVALPFAYLFAALALDRLLALPPARVGLLQLAALALLPGAAVVNAADYYRWQTLPATAQARQPALPVEDVPAWADAQAAALRGGPLAPTVAEWQRQRGRFLPPPTPAPAGPPRRPTPAAATPLAAQLLLRIGDPEELLVPRGVALAQNGDVLVADSVLRRVQRFDKGGRFLGSLPGEFIEPFDLAVGPGGEIYVLDPQLGTVLKFAADGTPAGVLGDNLGMYRPRGIGLDRAGNLYVADTGRDRVLVLSPQGQVMLTIKGVDVPFQQPTDVTVDDEGNVYIADPVEQRLLKLGPDGGFIRDWGISAADTLDSPHLAMTPMGEVVVSDPAQHRLVIFSPDGQILRALTSTEGEGALKTPLGLAVNPEGNVYVADKGDACVKKYGWER